ncbi:MAG: hypothetical protein HY298_00740 [Verrucomicrobia bacterium]|nr:hypothetical protein [Verrucomicrobiota bacterium]
MKNCALILAAFFCLVFDSNAAVPPAEKLLPDDTLVLLTVPDWPKARNILTNSPQGQFWNDPAMKPFKDKFMARLKEDVLTPLERDMGIRWEDFSPLAQGQLTFALTQNGWQGKDDQKMGWLLLVDTRDKTNQLKKNLADLKKKWVDSGKQLKSDKIRDVEFSTLVTSSNDFAKVLKKALPVPPPGTPEGFEDPDAKKTQPKNELIVGQTDSLLIVGNSAKAIEKLLVRLAGGAVPSLGELPAYAADHAAMFRDAPAYGWINAKLLVDSLIRPSSASADADSQPGAFLPSLSKVAAVLGLTGLKTAAFSLHNSNEGLLFHVFLGIPEAERRGLFKVLALETKESNPPPFVPADAVKFQRWRIDGQKAWATLETVITNLSPQLADFLQMTFNTIGKDQDATFDFKKSFFGNLGDDLISFQKATKGNAPADLNSPPTIYLVGSPNAEQLAVAFKSATAVMPPQFGGGTPVKDREFLGRKVYTLPAPPAAGDTGQRGFNFAASGGYLAMSSDVALLEQYLRSAETQAKSLRENPGINEAAQQVGGAGTGLFGYANESETMRARFGTMRKNPNSSTNSNNLALLASALSISLNQNNYNTWFDYSLLPEYDKVARYFHFSVYAGSANADGLTLKIFYPVPPQLKK